MLDFTTGETNLAAQESDGRRVAGHERKSWTLKEMQDIHHTIKRLLFLGMSNKAIADKLGVTAQMITLVKNSPIVKQQLKLMQKAADSDAIDLQAQIAEIAPKAHQNIKEVIETGSLNGEDMKAATVLKECNTMLDRHMGKPAQTIKGVHTHAHFTADEIFKLKQAATQVEDAEVIDAEILGDSENA